MTASSGAERAAASALRSPVDGPDRLDGLERTEAECRRYLEVLRWPDGICCPRCATRSIIPIPARRRFYCRECRHFFSLTSGTAFHNSHLPIWKWFLTIELILTTDDGVPANELTKILGGSYKTAWFIEHRIRAALHQVVGGKRSRRNGARLAIARTYAPPLVGRHHQLGLKYLPAYEAERRWQASQRQNPHAFRDTALVLLHAEPLSMDELIARGSAPLETSACTVN